MALTKITGQVINTATDVTVGVLTVTDTLAVGGTVSVGGTLTYEDVTNVDSVGLITARNGIVVGSGITLSKDGDGFFTGIVTATTFSGSGGVNVGGALTVTTSHSQVGIFTANSNGANIRLFDNDTESKIRTVDGRLQLHADDGDNHADSQITFMIGNDTKGFISAGSSFSIGNDADTYISRADANTLAVTTGGSEAVRIASDGKIGINTVTPRGRLHVLHGGSGFDYGTTGNLIVENNSGSTIQILSPSNNSGSIHFGDNDNGMVGRIKYDHVHDSMRFFTSNNERVTIKNSGYVGVGTTSASDFLHVNVTAQSQKGLLIESKDSAYGQITFDANKPSANQNLGKIVSKWNGTIIGEFKFLTGDDTTNKDDGYMTFLTSYDGTLAERMRLTESGQLCIGTGGAAASADNMLEIESTGTSIIKLNNTDDGVAQLTLANTGSSNGHIKQEAGVMRFLIANTEYMYLNGADLGIGESSPDSRLHVNSGGTNGVATFESTDGYAHIYVRDNGTHATGTYFGVQSDAFRWVTHDGSSSNERLRLTSDGYLLVGGHTEKNLGQGNTTTGVGLNPAGRLNVSRDGAASILLNRNNSNGPIVVFYREGVQEGNISITTSGVTYNTSSDYRLKENQTAISDAISRINQLKPYTFNFKANPSEKIDGFFAHEAQELIPYAVEGEKDGEEMQSIDYGKLTPLLTAALQEAVAKIETLESEVAALKGG